MTIKLNITNISKIITSNETEISILKPTSIAINDQDFVVILGTNGAGKSTFLNLITGNTQASTGSISINNIDITNLKKEKRAKYISQVFQDPKLGTAPRMTVAENLLLAQRRGLSRRLFPRKLKSQLKLFQELTAKLPNNLDSRLNTATEKLSGGQRQTLSFLMSVLKKPELLLLDEHTAALDPQTSNELMQLTDETIKSEKLTCLMITHNIEDALKYGNRLLIFNNGEIVLDANKESKSKLTKSQLMEYFD
ncbi:ABC transporter ATP-binding protein [Companilactobacillus sp. RD055328]|uniref:ABC transporter ATP-binding protein n=1 Tax=Companilactobacillus sp. RD055328 TaxID=2916634 RepID=UPI001FC833D6|nr:ATP-binding cassette domain-containing protein [Companilactobacillus sp. RD055328]GKQ43212.1 ABC transporter ATP-binding protein [Companilactobacillus sp. RD055328]